MSASAQPFANLPAVILTAPDFELRLRLCSPEDTAKGMFFNGVLDAVARLVDADARQVCLRASGERKFVDFFNYPVATFLRLSFTAAELLAPAVGGHDGAFRGLGHQATGDFLGSGVGKTLLLLAGREPERILAAVPSAFRTAVSYGERKTDLLGQNRAVVNMRRDFMPHPYHEGVLAAAVQAMGATEVEVRGQAFGPLDARYEVSWQMQSNKGGAS